MSLTATIEPYALRRPVISMALDAAVTDPPPGSGRQGTDGTSGRPPRSGRSDDRQRGVVDVREVHREAVRAARVRDADGLHRDHEAALLRDPDVDRGVVGQGRARRHGRLVEVVVDGADAV